LKVTDRSRLERAEEIRDEELTVEKADGRHFSAKIRNYLIIIDLDEERIVHDCDDWKKSLGQRRLCKHLCKFLLTLPEQQSTTMLNEIIGGKLKSEYKEGSHPD